MGDNGFHEFFNAETGPFAVFNPNASSRKEVATQARSVTEVAKDGASELDCDCCSSGVARHKGIVHGIETFYCCRCGNCGADCDE